MVKNIKKFSGEKIKHLRVSFNDTNFPPIPYMTCVFENNIGIFIEEKPTDKDLKEKIKKVCNNYLSQKDKILKERELVHND